MHLQVSMGGPEVWLETADMLEDGEFRHMLAVYGRFYMLPREEKVKESGGLLVERSFGFPYFAADLAAFSAFELRDETLAVEVWKELLQALAKEDDLSGFARRIYGEKNGIYLEEIPWIKTNFTAQWCLNTILALEFIRPWLPESLEEMMKWLKEPRQENCYHRS